MRTIITLTKSTPKGNVSQWTFSQRPAGLGYKATNTFGKALTFDSMDEVDESIEWFVSQGYARKERPARPVRKSEPVTELPVQEEEEEVVNTAPFWSTRAVRSHGSFSFVLFNY